MKWPSAIIIEIMDFATTTTDIHIRNVIVVVKKSIFNDDLSIVYRHTLTGSS